jgi:hypothetical protein
LDTILVGEQDDEIPTAMPARLAAAVKVDDSMIVEIA